MRYLLFVYCLCYFISASGQQQSASESRLIQFVTKTQFVDNDKWRLWPYSWPSSVDTYADITSRQLFGDILSGYRVFGRYPYELTANNTDRDRNMGFHEIFAIDLRETQFFDPTTCIIRENGKSRMLLALFSSQEAYQSEIKELEKICQWNQEDGSLRGKFYRFVAYPVVLADNAPKNRLYRGFKIYWY